MATAQHTVQGRGNAEDAAKRQLANEAYTVGWICALSTEHVAARAFLDEEHEGPEHSAQHDNNSYTLGRIGKHNVVIAVLPDGEYGTASAATVARDMLHSFPNVRIGLMVGIGGGAPSAKHDIRLGDIVVSAPRDGRGGVFQYDFGKTIQDQTFRETGFLAQPPTLLRTAVSGIRAQYESDGHQIQSAIEAALRMKPRLRKKYRQPDVSTDQLYRADVTHPLDEADCATSCSSDISALVSRPARDEEDDNPAVHYGLIASANQLMKDAVLRDKLAREKGVLCFEMEAAGLVNHFPCLVVRGICDYADTHKNKDWQGYAAMTAAAYAKDLLGRIAPNKVEAEKRLSELVTDVNENLRDVQTTTKHTQKTVAGLETDGRLKKIRTWLSPPDPSSNLNKAREQRHQGTGQWFLDSDAYRKWKTERNSFLWLNGIPGCGKTILSSSVVADLEQDGTSRSLIYFYFDFNDVEKQSAEKMVRSLVHQLYHNQMDLRKEVDALYLSCNNGDRQPDSLSLLKLFQSMVQQAGQLWIVLDALDECPGRSDGFAGGLLSWVRGLHDAGLDIHILVTSRPEQDIQAAIESWSCAEETIPLQSGLVSDDINTYIMARTKAMSRWQSRSDIQNKIETTLIQKADGMFRWVSCQIDVLKECLDPESLQNELANLPRTLDATYARILQNIRPEHTDRAKRLLQFLTYSERPLRVEEAVDAVTVHASKQPRFDPANRMPIPEEVVRYCSSLVTLVRREDKENGTEVAEIQLAHFSVQEYLKSDRLDPIMAADLKVVVARAVIVEVCLSYMLDLDSSYDPQKERGKYPLAGYSAQYWATHAAVVELARKAVLQEEKEYLSYQRTFQLGYRLYRPDQPWRDWNEQGELVPPLYCTSFTGLLYSVQWILGKGVDVNAQGGYYGNALQAASERGHEKVVQLLLDKGADVDAPDRNGFSALATAAYNGHQTVAQLLLDNSAEVNFSEGHQPTPLYWASSRGHLQMVCLLIQHNATVDSPTDDGRTALISASQEGHVEVVRLLLDKGSDLHAVDSSGDDALWHAMFAEHPMVEDLFRTAGAVATEDFYGIQALFGM